MANGSIAQLGEHLPYKQRVTGSSPVVPTTNGPVVQLVRTLACHARGRRFEPVPGRHFPFAFVAQLVEQRTENPRVVGSIPTEGTICGCSSSGRAPPCQGGGSGFEPRHPLQNKRTPFWCPFCFTMGWARKGRFAVGEFKQSGELFERPWACRQAVAQPSEPRHPLQEKDIDFGVFYFYIYISYIYMRWARKGRFA